MLPGSVMLFAYIFLIIRFYARETQYDKKDNEIILCITCPERKGPL